MTESNRVCLASLIPKSTAIEVGSVTLTIAPMGWYQAGGAMQHLLPVLSAMPAVGAELGDKRGDRAALWAGVIITYRDEIAAFCSEASGLALDQVKALTPIHMIELVMGLVEVNADYFAQAMPGVIAGALARMQRLSERWAPAIANAEASLQ